MKKLLLLSLASFICFSSSFAQNYQNAESVEYDPVFKRWLVSNGNNIIEDDGYGTLSVFSPDNASHGMEVLGNKLYAIDGDKIRVFDLELQVMQGFVTISGASFLNGMTSDGGNNLYVTDFGAGKIYKVDVTFYYDMTYEEIVSNTNSTPNGIVYDGDNNRLIFVNWGSNAAIKAVDLSDNTVSTILTTNLANIDGIDEDNEGNYYISSWNPQQISKFDKDFANPLEVITTPFINNPADIGYSLQNDTLGIPIGNNVVFVSFVEEDSMVATNNLIEEELAFTVYPNPISDQSYIQFELTKSEVIELEILDQQGKTIQTLLNGIQSSGNHKVLFAGHDLAVGIYYCRLEISGKSIVRKLVVL
jgi:type IX secretion system substrate protein/SMP-30/gluconolaconase/LRE-like protein